MEDLEKGDQMPVLKVFKIAVLFNVALLVGDKRDLAEVLCSSWSETMMGATLPEGYGL